MMTFGLRIYDLLSHTSSLPATASYASIAGAKAAFEDTLPRESARAIITESENAESVRISCEGRSDGQAVEWTEREAQA